MYKCHCGKEFDSAQKYGGHKGSHNRTESFKIGRKKSHCVYNCLYCNKESYQKRSKINKYCSHDCQARFKWENSTLSIIESGKCHHSRTLRKYLIYKFGEKCSECGQLPIHNNKPLTLQLDHLDGNSDNNFPKNIRLLCPNCHTQTSTYGSKGHGNRYKKETKRNKYLQQYKAGMV